MFFEDNHSSNENLCNSGYTKNNSLAINKIRKLSWDACGIYGMFDGTSLNVYLGSEGQKTRTIDVNNWQVRIIENDFTPFAFDNDATIVTFNHYVWVVGESVGCGKFLSYK